MLVLMAGLISATVVLDAAMSAAIYDVGRVALRDLPTINQNRDYKTYYAGVDTDHHDLLEVCPKLERELPAGYSLADNEARARASVHDFIAARTTPLTLLSSIKMPRISANLKTATVEMGYSCTGLCGASFIAHYTLTSEGWCRQGDIQIISIS